MSEVVQSQQGGTSSALSVQQSSASSSSSMQAASFSSFSSSSSSSSSATSSSTTKVVKQSVTTVNQSSSSSSSFSSSSTTSSSKMVSVKSSGISYSDRLAVDLGISDISKEMERLQLRLGDEMANIHRDMFQLLPSTVQEAIENTQSSSSSTSESAVGGANQFLVKMDNNAIKSCVDKAHDDRVKLNFDVNEFEAETINIRTVGNKIEVHAMKKSKKGDEERSEEFSRVYELPTENLDPSHVTSSIYKDGVLTIELPLNDALGTTASQ